MKLSINQNRAKHFLIIAVAVLVMAGFVPVRAKAETYKEEVKIIELKQNTTLSSKGYDTYYPDTDTYVHTSIVYKITVPANGYIKLNVSNKSAWIQIYKKINKEWEYFSWDNEVADSTGKKLYYYVLPKGTYYIPGNDDTSFKWSFTKVARKTNYCRAKAQSISAGKTYTLISQYEYEHYRWYKVKLTSKKKLYIKCKGLDREGTDVGADVAVYDSNRIWKKTKLSGVTFRTTAKLPKGTYYIRLRVGDDVTDENYYSGRLCQLSWSAK